MSRWRLWLRSDSGVVSGDSDLPLVCASCPSESEDEEWLLVSLSVKWAASLAIRVFLLPDVVSFLDLSCCRRSTSFMVASSLVVSGIVTEVSCHF